MFGDLLRSATVPEGPSSAASSYQYIGATDIGGGASPRTFNPGVITVAASSLRLVVATLVITDTAGGIDMSAATVTIGGFAATLAIQASTTETYLGNTTKGSIFYALVPTGTSATISITHASSANIVYLQCAISAFTVLKAAPRGTYEEAITGSLPVTTSGTITAHSGGLVMAAMASQAGYSEPASFGPTAGAVNHYGGDFRHLSDTTAFTPPYAVTSYTGSGTAHHTLVFASWG